MPLDELKTLLALNGNARIPHLEDEIFANKELYTWYLVELNKDKEWFSEFDPCEPSDIIWLACSYANDVIKGRWTEAEVLIMADPWLACMYSEYLIEDRWPEAESVIATDPYASFEYARVVIEGRWPEGEAAIATDAEMSYTYAEMISRI
jgi:hypothetical protein